MKLRTIDRISRYILIIGGVLQMLATPLFFPSIEEPAFWFFNGGLTLLLVGLLNDMRIKQGEKVRSLRQLSFAANFALFVLWIGMAFSLWYKFERYPFALVPLFALGISSVFSLKSQGSGRQNSKTSDING